MAVNGANWEATGVAHSSVPSSSESARARLPDRSEKPMYTTPSAIEGTVAMNGRVVGWNRQASDPSVACNATTTAGSFDRGWVDRTTVPSPAAIVVDTGPGAS